MNYTKNKFLTLNDYLRQNRISKAKFARDIGVSPSALYKYLNREREPILTVAVRINKITKGKVSIASMALERFEYSKKKKTVIVEDEDLL